MMNHDQRPFQRRLKAITFIIAGMVLIEGGAAVSAEATGTPINRGRVLSAPVSSRSQSALALQSHVDEASGEKTMEFGQAVSIIQELLVRRKDRSLTEGDTLATINGWEFVFDAEENAKKYTHPLALSSFLGSDFHNTVVGLRHQNPFAQLEAVKQHLLAAWAPVQQLAGRETTREEILAGFMAFLGAIDETKNMLPEPTWDRLVNGLSGFYGYVILYRQERPDRDSLERHKMDELTRLIENITEPSAVLYSHLLRDLLLPDPDLTALSTEKGKELARVVRQVLDEVQFDAGNGVLRDAGLYGDYARRPFPLPDAIVGVEEIKSRAGAFAPRLQRAFEFFTFGESLSREALEELLGRDRAQLIDEYIELGLFIITPDSRIRMNGLSLMSRKLENGEVVYILADTPSYFETQMDPQRVYVGDDSYLLMDRVSKAPPVSGYCVDMGSGSGIQLIAALKLFPALTRAIGLEIDQRAIHVAQFNAALNGVDDRVAVVHDEAALRRELGDNPVSLAMINPPFKALPAFIDLGPEHRDALTDIDGVDKGTHGFRVDLRTLFAKAGWGGEDGIFVTKQFLEVLWPLLGPDSHVIIYSHFAGNAWGPTKIAEYVTAQGGVSFAFESSGPKTVFTKRARGGVGTSPETWPAQVNARSIVQFILQLNPQLQEKQDLLMQFLLSIAESYQRQGITHFHDGFAVLSGSGVAGPGVIRHVTPALFKDEGVLREML